MNKEEILAISQSENKGKDVADVELSKTGIRVGWIVTVCLAVAAAIIDGAVFGRPGFELLFAVGTGLAVVFFRKYAKAKKRHELIVALCYSVASVAWLVAWLLQMCNG